MVTYAYTLSSAGLMFESAFFSIQTLRRFVDSDDIVVFFTPPRDDEHVESLEALGVDLRLVENVTDAFVAFDDPQHYGEKTWISTLDDDTVVFLDCDTLVFDDVRDVIRGDFEFKARQDTSQVRQPAWRELFERFDEPYLDWMPNAGFLVFKRGLHRRIGDTWRKYIQTELEYQHEVNHKEQYALALAVGGAETVQMTPEEHSMAWGGEFPPDSVVCHIGKLFEREYTAPDTFKGNLAVGLRRLAQGKL